MNPVLKRTCCNKSQAMMTLADLEAATGWRALNYLRDHLQLLRDGRHCAWTAR